MMISIESTLRIVLTTPDQVDMFLSKGQLQIKGNANATAAKWGRNADAGLSVGSNKSNATNSSKYAISGFYTYSFGNKGIYGGVSMDGEVLAVRSGCNEGFYQKAVNVKDILTGLVPMPKENGDYDRLTQLLNDYCTESDGDDGKEDDDELDLMDTTPLGPDDGDDAVDQWQIYGHTGGKLQFLNGGSTFLLVGWSLLLVF